MLFIIAGCTEMSVDEIPCDTNDEFFATIEGADSRTYIDDQIRTRWTAKDCITLFGKTTYSREYEFTGATGSNAGGFRQKSVDDPYWAGEAVPANYAVYPHSSDTQLDKAGFFTLTMPAEQTYVENSFGPSANTMVAVSENNQLTFKNVGSYLRIRLYGVDGIAVSSVVLTSNGNEAIAGTAEVTPSMTGDPICKMTGTSKSIRLNCATPVSISTDEKTPTDFWIVLPPVTFSKGFSVTVEKADGSSQVYKVESSATFARNKYYNFQRKVSITGTPYVTFSAKAPQTLTMTNAVSTLEYSVNNSDWAELGTTTVTFGGTYGILRLRGESATGTAKYDEDTHNRYDCATIKFGNDVKVSCSGDIRTLVDYEHYATANTSNARFIGLFEECTSLATAPSLPLTALAGFCYEAMFNGCTSLTKAPELPATTLGEYCYQLMFSGCMGLTKAPKLPATTLTRGCYASMFSGCRSLTEAPELPATALTRYCYASMFSGCTSLTKAPDLPATTLDRNCYEGMFAECTSLTAAPELPATALTGYCYSDMFAGCTSLTKAPELPATTLDRNCYEGMFSGCTSLTAAPELPATVLTEDCYSSMFAGCTSLTKASDLPATALAAYCYNGMFGGCTSLTIAPELPATTLEEYCYAGMFGGCTSLKTAPKLPATTLTEDCYTGMFSGCKSLTAAPELPATTLGEYCYQLMFAGCIGLTKAPRLPATTLARGCYASMFGGCTSLTAAPELPATILTEYCYENMFSDCTSLTAAPKLPATALAAYCYSKIFHGCRKLNNITMLATDISAIGGLDNWVMDVASSGIFTKANTMESLPEGSSGIPRGWSVKNL